MAKERTTHVFLFASQYLLVASLFAGSGCLLESEPEPEPEPVMCQIRYTVERSSASYDGASFNVWYEIEGRRTSVSLGSIRKTWEKSFEAESPGSAFVKATFTAGNMALFYPAKGTVTVRIYVDGTLRAKETGESDYTSRAEASFRY